MGLEMIYSVNYFGTVVATSNIRVISVLIKNIGAAMLYLPTALPQLSHLRT